MRHALVAALSIALGLAASAPSFAQAAPASSSTHAAGNSADSRDRAAALAMLQSMVSGQWQVATRGFDAAMAAALPPAGVRQFWQQMQAQYGAYHAHGAPVTGGFGPFHNVVIPLDFARGTVGLRFTYDARGQLAGLHLTALPEAAAAPTPTQPVLQQLFAQQDTCMRAQPVVVDSGGAQLHGTLTVPRTGRGPFTALLLIPGSGTVDQNGDAPGALQDAAYRQLAQGLSCDGFAVLRYNKPGLAPSTGEGNAATLATYVRNVRDLVAWLATQPRVDARRIVLMGHSEGGLIALASANQTPAAGVVLLESPGESMSTVIAQQAEAQARARGAPAQTIARHQAQIAQALAAVRASHGVAMSLHGALADNPYAVLFAHAAGLLRSELDVDPAALARTSERPVLVVQGGKDLQVLPANGERLRHAVRDGTLTLLPTMTHDLIACTGEAIGCLQPPPDTRIDPQLIPAITRWLHALPTRRTVSRA